MSYSMPVDENGNPQRGGPQGGKPRKLGGNFVPRFAGEAFAHLKPGDPMSRRLVSTVAWKVPPSADLRSQVST